MNIFVGNLSFDSTERDVKELFEGFGNVASVAIVMSKDKKTSRSRGFGFVEMPDAQQALAAIAALNEKEFMGRVLNVEPARPKTEAQAARELKKEPKPGTYRGGRRTHSYMKRQVLAGVQEVAKPRRRSQDNPMRWRKKKDQAGPWQKSPGEHKPWKKAEQGVRTREKPAVEAKPWSKSSEHPQKPRFKSRGKLGRYKR
jgi:RNA recognition motif-containing protein